MAKRVFYTQIARIIYVQNNIYIRLTPLRVGQVINKSRISAEFNINYNFLSTGYV